MEQQPKSSKRTKDTEKSVYDAPDSTKTVEDVYREVERANDPTRDSGLYPELSGSGKIGRNGDRTRSRPHHHE
jgi:hypothetical protein